MGAFSEKINFGHYLGHFWAILYHFGPFQAILGHFRVILAIFRSFFGNFSPFSVRQFGVDITGLIWTSCLNISDHFWPVLGYFWPFWVIFGHFRFILAIFWYFLVFFWQFSAILGQVIWCWYYWHHLDHFPKHLRQF